ncbi:hypothetical protein DMENIID0001_043500 [Sergentomyia squamirostris]
MGFTSSTAALLLPRKKGPRDCWGAKYWRERLVRRQLLLLPPKEEWGCTCFFPSCPFILTFIHPEPQCLQTRQRGIWR